MPSAILRWRRLHRFVALAILAGIVAGYMAARIYGWPFDRAAAAVPKMQPSPPPAATAMPAQFAPPTNPPIPVVQPRAQSVSSYVEITGNAAAVNAVKLIARVEGYLDQIHYEDGQFVKKGDLLFTIQQDQYKDQLQQAQAQLLTAQAL